MEGWVGWSTRSHYDRKLLHVSPSKLGNQGFGMFSVVPAVVTFFHAHASKMPYEVNFEDSERP